jgi:hypothetical protein
MLTTSYIMPRKRLNTVQIRLDDETNETLKAEAERQHRPLANLIAAILADHAAALRAKGAR